MFTFSLVKHNVLVQDPTENPWLVVHQVKIASIECYVSAIQILKPLKSAELK